jgi:hypothetical protein
MQPLLELGINPICWNQLLFVAGLVGELSSKVYVYTFSDNMGHVCISMLYAEERGLGNQPGVAKVADGEARALANSCWCD